MLFKFDLIGVGFHSCFDFVQHHERYERLLRRAKTEDLSEVSGIGCLYQSGIDKFGRPVIVFIGKWFNFTEINLDKVFDTKKSSHDNNETIIIIIFKKLNCITHFYQKPTIFHLIGANKKSIGLE